MKSLLKAFVAALAVPVFRALVPVFENVKRLAAFLLLNSRVRGKVPSSVVVYGPPEIHGEGNVKFGENLLLYPGLYLETRNGAAIDIGAGVVMSRGVHVVAYAGVSIGAGSMIGEYSSIRDANHIRAADGAMRDGDHSASSITIGSQVWIGRGVTILPGVSIGNNATVGANAVVTRSVPAGAIVAGVPAVPLRSKLGHDLRAS